MIKIIDEIRNLQTFNSSRVYLIKKISDISGFFLFENKISYGKIVLQKSDTFPIATELLEFFPNVPIKSVENNHTFSEGLYDFLVLKNEDLKYFSVFKFLCETYSMNPVSPFDEFINGMIDLFQMPKKQSVLNAEGLFGELSFILYMYQQYHIDLTKSWHLHGSNSKYDFSLEKLNIEIKTSLNDNTSFLIKHSQLFDGRDNYVCLVKIKKESSSSLSLNELIKFMRMNPPFSLNPLFQINLEKELKKDFDLDALNEKYSFDGFFMFDCKKLKTINFVPFCISNITYTYDFDISDSLDVKEYIKLLSK